MTAKLITLAGLLLLMGQPVFADQAQPGQAQTSSAQAQPVQTTPCPSRLAWQRVGSPLSQIG
jgi:hypothetical protein